MSSVTGVETDPAINFGEAREPSPTVCRDFVTEIETGSVMGMGLYYGVEKGCW